MHALLVNNLQMIAESFLQWQKISYWVSTVDKTLLS